MLRGKHALKLASAGAAVDDAPDSGDEAELVKSNDGPNGAFALTLSSVWQEAAENALNAQEKRGAIVVLDVRDGSILALVSKPGFDPNLLTPPRTGAARQQQIKALLEDPEKPLLNRAISGEYPLGSIMKSLIASVALEKGLLTTDETFECPGYIKEGGQIFHCDGNHAHGTVNVYKGLRCSCNVMFHQVGARIGVENLGPFAKLVLGARTGIDLPAESAGVYPDRAWRQKTFPRNPQARIWTRGNDFQLAIGQGQMNATVLQAAVLMATVSNGGNVVTPHLRLDAPPAPPKPLGVHERALNIVRRGLDECVNVGTPGERGTCYSPFHANGELPVRVAGKTSTAEHGHELAPHAWFAGYFPSDHPRYAFAVLLEEAGHGGAVAGPVAFNMLREIYGTRQNPNPHPGERAKNVAQADSANTLEGR
jgi:penicillin-binding protein 2